MVWIYFTNCFSWHVNKAPTENREKHEMQHEEKSWKKYQAIQHRPYKVKHTSIQWIDCMVHLERVEKTQLKWKTISDTLILYHLCVSVFQEKHRLSNGTQYSFFLVYSLSYDPCAQGVTRNVKKKYVFQENTVNATLNILKKIEKKLWIYRFFWVLSIISNDHQLFCFFFNRKTAQCINNRPSVYISNIVQFHCSNPNAVAFHGKLIKNRFN